MVCNAIFEPIIAEQVGVTFALVFGLGICVCSWICCVFLVLLDAKADSQIEEEEVAEKAENVNMCKETCSLKLPFWLLMTIVTFVCGVNITYTVNISLMLETEFLLPKNQSSYFYGLPRLMMLFISPLTGFMISKFGRRAYFLLGSITGITLTCIVSLTLVQLNIHNYLFIVPLVLLGIADSFFGGSLWTSIPCTVPEQSLGIAFGILDCLRNASITVDTFVTGKVLSTPGLAKNGFPLYLMIIAVLSGLGLLAAIALICDDKINRGGVLTTNT